MTTAQITKEHLKTKNLSAEQKAKLESLEAIDELEKLADKIDASTAHYYLEQENE